MTQHGSHSETKPPISSSTDYQLPPELAPNGTAELIDAICERMIPPTPRWPAASEIRLGAAIERHLRETEWVALTTALGQLCSKHNFTLLDDTEQDALISAFETEQPGSFGLLRQVLYLGYYAQPQVVSVFRDLGFDVNDSPQPNGYSMAPFDNRRVPIGGPGGWIPTREVVRVSALEGSK